MDEAGVGVVDVVVQADVDAADGVDHLLDAAHADLSSDGPFDAIVLSGSVAELPQSMLDLLKPGGRLMAIVGDEPMMRATLVQHAGNSLVSTQPWDTCAPRLLNFPEPARFRF